MNYNIIYIINYFVLKLTFSALKYLRICSCLTKLDIIIPLLELNIADIFTNVYKILVQT